MSDADGFLHIVVGVAIIVCIIILIFGGEEKPKGEAPGKAKRGFHPPD